MALNSVGNVTILRLPGAAAGTVIKIGNDCRHFLKTPKTCLRILQ